LVADAKVGRSARQPLIHAEIIAAIERIPESADWPDLARVFDRAANAPRPDWELPIRACLAVGGEEAAAVPAAAAVACLQISIIVADDLLDDDPRGAHHAMGPGPAANLALGFQAAAFRLIADSALQPPGRSAAYACLARMALRTAVGQQLDVQNFQDEVNYWRIVEAKSTPFYGGALQLGAIFGGSSEAQAVEIYEIGRLIGEIIQLEDDLEDALQVPANADWKQGRNNLLILFARTADHPGRGRFLELIGRIDDEVTLAEAQRILITSGAVSYCAYQLIARYREARETLGRLSLPHPQPLEEILEAYGRSLADRLRVAGIDLSLADIKDTPRP
jgi:geranylgeranyl pyrophosphate synthase